MENIRDVRAKIDVGSVQARQESDEVIEDEGALVTSEFINPKRDFYLSLCYIPSPYATTLVYPQANTLGLPSTWYAISNDKL